ncbi:abc transporter b family member 5 [Quercus suber]|uniref:Abc transporter b family member 5 n=1 Tax=Quercus suber TaxID=58331 RepID=A0AAW0KW60_QUESU
MGLVNKELILFNDTIRANIAYGKERDATEAEIIYASELANANKLEQCKSFFKAYVIFILKSTNQVPLLRNFWWIPLTCTFT